tara:strand:- start:353 stop:697 length:345 start_codon:yes stop_codon:yes gene_type:complete
MNNETNNTMKAQNTKNQQVMKVLTTDLEIGMKIKLNLFDYSGNPIYADKTNRYKGETAPITKKSPSFTVKSITEMKTTYSISRIKRTPRRNFAIEVEEMNDKIELSAKQKITIA